MGTGDKASCVSYVNYKNCALEERRQRHGDGRAKKIEAMTLSLKLKVAITAITLPRVPTQYGAETSMTETFYSISF